MEEQFLFQALGTIKGELVQDVNGRLALMCNSQSCTGSDGQSPTLCDRSLVKLFTTRGYGKVFNRLYSMTGSCVVLTGYPRFNATTNKLCSLAVISTAFISKRHPGQFNISGILYPSSDEGQFLIRVEPRPGTVKPFFIPIGGYIPNARKLEVWCVEAELDDRQLVMIEAKRLREAPIRAKRRRKEAA